MHLIFLPLSFIHFTIGPNIFSDPRDFVILKLSSVCASVSKGEAAVAVLLTVDILAFILGTVWPLFDASSVLLVFEPLANICGSICMFICSMAMSFIIVPLTFVDVSVGMN